MLEAHLETALSTCVATLFFAFFSYLLLTPLPRLRIFGYGSRFSAPFPTTMLDAEIGSALNTFVANLFSAPFPTAMLEAHLETALSTCVAPIFFAFVYFALLTPLSRLRIFGYGSIKADRPGHPRGTDV